MTSTTTNTPASAKPEAPVSSLVESECRARLDEWFGTINASFLQKSYFVAFSQRLESAYTAAAHRYKVKRLASRLGETSATPGLFYSRVADAVDKVVAHVADELQSYLFLVSEVCTADTDNREAAEEVVDDILFNSYIDYTAVRLFVDEQDDAAYDQDDKATDGVAERRAADADEDEMEEDDDDNDDECDDDDCEDEDCEGGC